MDDPRTTQALRELAELYLSPQKPLPDDRESELSGPALPGPALPTDELPGSELPEGELPGAGAGVGGIATDSPLRLTPDDSVDSSLSQGPPELLIAGHLPGLANLWISQYAQRLTQTHTSVVTLHLGEDDIALDCYGPPPSRRGQFIAPVSGLTPRGPSPRRGQFIAPVPAPGTVPPSAPAPGLAPRSDSLPPTLPEAINVLAPHVAHWLLHLAHPTDLIARVVAHQTDQWTLLTGCDEAAIVAAYRLLKQLLEGRPHDQPLPAVQLMFLGCDQSDAQLATQRLARTAHEHLNIIPTLLGCQQQMLPVRRRRLGRYPLDTDPAHLLTTLTHLPRRGQFIAPGLPPANAVPPLPALCSFLPTLHLLQARAPRHPAVELALDDANRLHLLGRDVPQAACADDIIPQLFAAAAWAVEHLPLLALTSPDRPFDLAAAPVLHLFTERARHFGSLAHAGRPDRPLFKLHLLLPVTVADTTTFTAIELN